jgi:hypothetical protein
MAVDRATWALWPLLGALAMGGVMLLGGCGDDEASVAAAVHPWINPPRAVDDQAVMLSPWLIHPVAPAVLDEVVAELETEPYIQISPSMASYYTQTDMQVPAEMRPFLVRGLDAGNSEITVVQSTLGLWIKAVGGDGSAIRPRPLVVLIDPTPVEIFVTVEPAG